MVATLTVAIAMTPVAVSITGVAAGASGIACGVVRNNYFQPAMSELMQACVEVWESDPEAYAYNPVGYIALGPEAQEADLAATFERLPEFGTMMALGDRGRDVLRLIMSECVILGLLGSVIGVVAGMVIALLVAGAVRRRARQSGRPRAGAA